MAFIFPPVPVNLAMRAVLPPAGLNANGQTRGGPFLFGGAMYVFCETGNFPATTCTAFKSLDDGQTWAALDVGGSDSNGNFGCSFDGDHTVQIAFSGGELNILPTSVQAFDLSTELWGASTGGGPDSELVWASQILGNGSTLIIISYETADHLGDPFRATIWNGASFSPAFSINQNALDDIGRPLQFPDLQFTYCMSADGLTMHAFFPWQNADTIDPINYICYQAVTSGGALGPFVATSSADGNFQLTSQPGNPVLYGNFLLVAHSDQGTGAQSLLAGTPVANPVFTALPTFDPGFNGGDTSLADGGNGFPFVFGGALYVLYAVRSPNTLDTFNALRLAITTNPDPTLGWGASTIFNGETDGGAGWVQGTLGSPWMAPDTAGRNGIIVKSLDPTETFFTSFWIGAAAAAPLLLASPALTVGKVGTPYPPAAYVASGGTEPYSYAISAGALPPGLVIDAATGIISGTPTAMGTFCYTVTVTDADLATADASDCITIQGSVIITLLGWKLYADSPCAAPVEAIEPPHVIWWE